MSNPVVTKLAKMLAQGPSASSASVTKIAKFIVVDTTRSDTSGGGSARKRVLGGIRYGDDS